jgi:hypothetical protein
VALDAIHEHRLPEGGVGNAAEIADVGETVGLHVGLRHPPHILIFDIGGVRPLHYPYRQQVLAGVGVGTDIELGGEATPLAEADVVAVHIDLEVGIHPVKLDDHLLAILGRAQREAALIGAGGLLVGTKGTSMGKGKPSSVYCRLPCSSICHMLGTVIWPHSLMGL